MVRAADCQCTSCNSPGFEKKDFDYDLGLGRSQHRIGKVTFLSCEAVTHLRNDKTERVNFISIKG